MIEQLENEKAAMLLCLHDIMKPPAYTSLRRGRSTGRSFDTAETREDELGLLEPQLSVMSNTGDNEVDRVSKQLICGSLALKYQCLNKSRLFCLRFGSAWLQLSNAMQWTKIQQTQSHQQELSVVSPVILPSIPFRSPHDIEALLTPVTFHRFNITTTCLGRLVDP
jgi:hypothetical protein